MYDGKNEEDVPERRLIIPFVSILSNGAKLVDLHVELEKVKARILCV